MSLGSRLYDMARAFGALPFGELSKDFVDLGDEARDRWEKTATAIDAATRADVVGQLGTMALNTRAAHEYQTLRQAADRVEAGRD